MPDSKLNIAIQGIIGSYHYQVAQIIFGKEIGIIECMTFSDLVKRILKGEADQGVLALENSIAGAILPNYDLMDRNNLRITGALCREPTYRRTPLGREICDAMLAVPRAFRRADYLPCILWGRMAQMVSECHTRDVISIDGRLQSRIYNKYVDDRIVERTAYEISALTAEVLTEPE